MSGMEELDWPAQSSGRRHHPTSVSDRINVLVKHLILTPPIAAISAYCNANVQ